MKLLEGQFRVEAHDDALHFLQVCGDGEAFAFQFCHKRAGAADIELLAGVILFQIESSGLGGGHKVLPGGLDAQLCQLLYIVGNALGRVVGDEQVLAAGALDLAKQFNGKIVQPVA